jgi:Zn-dependent protease with chaperone function
MTAFAISFVIAALAAFFLNGLALAPWKRAGGDLHWTETAALLYPARSSARLNALLIGASLALASGIVRPGSTVIAAWIGGILGPVLGGYPMDRAIHPGMTFRSWFQIVLGQLALGALGWAILIGFALAMPPAFGWKAWILFGGYLVIHAALQMGAGLRLARVFGLIRPPPERLSRIVGEVSREMGVSVRATWAWRSANSNALALVTTRELAFTEKLLETLPDDEIRAICAHEIGHLTESRWVLAARLIGGLWLLPLVLVKPVVTQYGLDDFALLALACWLLRFLPRRLFRRMEKRADSVAVASLADSGVYARALERMYRTNQMPAVLPRRRGAPHPDLYDRMTAAGVVPDYPRPAPPKSRSWTSWAMAAVAAALAIAAFGDLIGPTLRVR